MRFSVFLNARALGENDDAGLFRDLEAHALLAGELGFDAVFLPDHHFNGYMPMASDSFIFAAYLAAKLPAMHFGFSVVNVALQHPVRLAERINILDHLTRGKLLVGTGSGTTPEEMIGFGVTYEQARPLANQNLDLMERLWAKQMTDDDIEFDGFYKGALLQRIAPVSYGDTHARLMPVAMNEISAQRAADNAWPAFIPAFTPPVIGGTEPFKHVEKHFSNYLALLQAAGHPQQAVDAALDWTTHTYQCVHVAETDAQARAELEEILSAYQDAVNREAEFNRRAEERRGNVKSDKTPDALSEDWIGTWCLYGSPDTVAEHLQPYQALGIGNVLCGTVTGPLTPRRQALSDQTLRLLAGKVRPALENGNG